MTVPTTAAISLLVLCSCTPRGDIQTITGQTMGTTYRLRIVGGVDRGFGPAVNSLLDSFEDELSTYRDTSAISRFNRSGAGEWFPVKPWTIDVLAVAKTVHEQSGGAFDITVGPLVRTWDFRQGTIPTEQEVAASLARVSMESLRWEIDPPVLKKKQSATEVDVSAVAKGYAVDLVADLLERRGVEAFLVEIGGEVRTRGRKPDGTPWTIGIEAPDRTARRLYRTVSLRDAAMATSGDYRNFFRGDDGIYYSHILDPRSGRPVNHRLAAVTVIADRCAVADAWATALLVLGPEPGYALAEEMGLAALFLDRDGGDGFTERATPEFQRRNPEPEN